MSRRQTMFPHVTKAQPVLRRIRRVVHHLVRRQEYIRRGRGQCQQPACSFDAHVRPKIIGRISHDGLLHAFARTAKTRRRPVWPDAARTVHAQFDFYINSSVARCLCESQHRHGSNRRVHDGLVRVQTTRRKEADTIWRSTAAARNDVPPVFLECKDNQAVHMSNDCARDAFFFDAHMRKKKTV